MKKFLSIVLACMLWATGGIFLTGCGKTKVTKMVLKRDTIQTTVIKDGLFSTANAVVTVTYSNKESEDVTAENLSFSTIDTSVVGKQTLTITYNYNNKDYTLDVQINVVATDSELYTIISMESDLWKDYTNNKKDRVEFKNTFYDSTQPLTVGADNWLDLRIHATGVDDKGNEVAGIQNVRTSVTVEKKDAGNNYAVISDYSAYLTVDTVTSRVQFKKGPGGAVGSTFRLTFKAATSDSVYQDAQTMFTAEVLVEDGFNVYTIDDLSLFDNQKWQESTRASVRAKYGLDATYYPSAMFLLNNISLTKEDLPNHYFYLEHDADDELAGSTYLAWAQAADAKMDEWYPNEKHDTIVGSPINYYGTGLYHREMKSGDQFSFNGNYFMVDVSKFPLTIYQNDKSSNSELSKWFASENNGLPYGPYQSLFFVGNCNASRTVSQESVLNADTHFSIENTQFLGNGELTNDMRKSGGLMMLKNRTVNFTGRNTLANNFGVGYFFEDGDVHNQYDGEFVVDYCKGFGSFESLFYMNNPEHVVIKHSAFKDAGGPVIIADHDKGAKDDPNGDTAPKIDIVDSDLSSLVNASSPWFKTFEGAGTLVTAIQAVGEKFFDNTLEQLFGIPHSNKTLVQTAESDEGSKGKVIDIIALLKTNGVNIMGANKLLGYVRTFEDETQYNAYYNDGVINTHGLDFFDETKYIGGQHSISDYVLSTNTNNEPEDNNVGDIIMQSTNGGFVNLGSLAGLMQIPQVTTPQENVFFSSVKFGATAAGHLSTILGTLGQTYNGNFADMKYHVDQMSANLLTRFNAYYAGEETKLNSFFNTLAGTEHTELAQAVGTLKVLYPFGVSSEAWNLLNKDQKYQAIVDYLTGIETNNLYATGNYLNLYLFNGMGAMLKLYDRAAA